MIDTDPSSSADPRPTFGHELPWRVIPTKLHGILDYGMGLFLIVLPFLPGFPKVQDSNMPLLVPTVLGSAVILYSLFTNYELGAVRWLHMVVHLLLDVLGGIILFVSPWAFSFEKEVYLPFVILGALEVGAALCTKNNTTTRSLASTNHDS